MENLKIPILMAHIKTKSTWARPEFPNTSKEQALYIPWNIFYDIFASTVTSFLYFFHLSACKRYRKKKSEVQYEAFCKQKEEKKQPWRSPWNYNTYAKYDSNHWKQQDNASRTKTHNSLESFRRTGKNLAWTKRWMTLSCTTEEPSQPTASLYFCYT